ncbi:MAG TPA: hypothetical protein VLA52_06505, partial [Thermohalobaculum sp.]|nr:hypothetical protein [Thermohalobaculum sp.]
MNDPLEARASFSLEGWPALLAIIVVMVVLYGIPAMWIVRRAGLVQWWGLLAAVPLVNIVAIWVFATCR